MQLKSRDGLSEAAVEVTRSDYVGFLVLALCFVGSVATAAEYPTRHIRLIVPYPPVSFTNDIVVVSLSHLL